MRSTLILSLLAAGCGNSYTYAGQDAAAPNLAPAAPDLAMGNPGDCDLVTQNCPDPKASKCAFEPTIDPSGTAETVDTARMRNRSPPSRSSSRRGPTPNAT